MRRLACLLLAAALPVGALAQPPRCDNCGTIASIRQVTASDTWTPLGAGTPGTRPGDIAGPPGRVTTAYDFTSGNMVILGSAGGAGYAKRPNAYQRPRWEVTIRMERGGMRTVMQDYEPVLREGDRVRVLGTQVELAD
jgi:outer membrane lipoprotein SlyB